MGDLSREMKRKGKLGGNCEKKKGLPYLVRTDGEKREHPLHHEAGVEAHLLLVYPSNKQRL
jgi:hypothetical protein